MAPPFAAAVLLEAAALIERDGWAQHIGFDPETGGRCALFAIRDAHDALRPGEGDYDSAPSDLLRDHLGTRFVSTWNDAPGRTMDEVVAALRSAAALAGGA